MLRAGARVPRGCRWGALIMATLIAASAAAGSADARPRRHHRAAPAAAAYQPDYASIVVDANSGAVMQATNADSSRHPASLTKIMTLYLLFERLEAGKIKMTTEMSVSPHAAAMAPSKLGLKPGETIAVETAIRAIVTKSANDVAVIIAETLGGSEDEFARLMTAKARALGMMHTVYRNASGLPDDAQVTTARDMAILGRAIQDRFSQFYHYFSTRTFAFRGRTVRNHNHLLGAVDGVDGIKTGYIHDSGFNIVTSVNRNNRHIVAVVFGGHTAEARDARVRSLIDNNINIASAKRTAPPVVEGWASAEARKETADKAAESKATEHKTAAAATPQPPEAPAVIPGSTDPIKPNPVKTFAVAPGSARIASLSPLPSASRKLMPAPATANAAAITTVTTVRSEPVMPLPPAAPTAAEAPTKTAEVAAAGAAAPETAPKARGDWIIQVGAFDTEIEAKERLNLAQTKAKDLLGQANPFTEKAAKGDKTMFRARFAGLDKIQAESACKNLKRSDIPCMLLKN
jgi:D-alanyl-D-alanine carboxypeptidase